MQDSTLHTPNKQREMKVVMFCIKIYQRNSCGDLVRERILGYVFKRLTERGFLHMMQTDKSVLQRLRNFAAFYWVYEE